MNNSPKLKNPHNRFPFYILKNVDQKSEFWRVWRNAGIGGSDAPIVMGENPWNTLERLMEIKTSYPDKQVRENEAMITGAKREPYARKKYIETTGEKFFPLCIQHKELHWMRASLDGITKNLSRVVEIKCGDRAYEYAQDGRVKPEYVGQLQHIMAITGISKIDYWAWVPGKRGILIEYDRDEEYVRKMVNAEYEFYKMISCVFDPCIDTDAMITDNQPILSHYISE